MILKRLSLLLALVVVVGLVLPCFAETVTYEYDDLYRLKKATYSDGTVIEYTYDAAGNRHSVIKMPSAQAPTVSISADPVSIPSGASSTLTWSTTNATSCTIDHGIGAVNTNGSTTVSPSETTTYTITATGPGGTATSSVIVFTPTPTVSISANPTTIKAGSPSILTWESTDATSCTIMPSIGTVNPNGTVSVSPKHTTTYTITASGRGGSAMSSVTVTVTPSIPPLTVSISAAPASIDYGGSSILTWTSTNATSCTIDQGIGAVAANGSTVVSPSTTTTYTITATGPGGTASASATITIGPPAPTVSITADPTTTVTGSATTLSWSSTNADSCTIDQAIGSVNLNGSIVVFPSAASTTYTITATGPGGTATSSATVSILSQIRMIDLGTFGGTSGGRASLINNLGQACGAMTNASEQWHAFFWSHQSGMVDLGTLGNGESSAAFGLNNLGQVVGASTTEPGVDAWDFFFMYPAHAFLWTAAGGMIDLGTLGGDTSEAFGINDQGQVVGYSRTASGDYHPFLWTAAGEMVDLGTLGGSDAYAWGINNQGQVWGDSNTASGENHAFLWTAAGGMVDVGTLSGTWSSPNAINDLGQVVGYSEIPPLGVGEAHAFLWTAAGGMIDLGTLGKYRCGTYYCNSSYPYDINNHWQVVGSSTTASGDRHAFLWTAEGGMLDLGTLAPPDPSMPHYSEAYRINDQGQVVGESDTLSWNHGFLWTAEGGMLDLGTLGGISHADAINDVGQIVGFSRTASGEMHFVLWETGSPSVPTVSISADPSTIQSGGASTLTWASTNATSCTIDHGIGTVSTSGSITVSPTTTTTYTVTATGPGGTATNSVMVTVTPSSAPTVTLSADPTNIQSGGSSTLSWTSTNATSCTIDQGIGTVNTSGSIQISPAQTTTYTITATGPGGTATKSVIVTVASAPVPTVTITANPPGIVAGASSTLIWTSSNAELCSIDQGIGVVTVSGTTAVSPTTTTTYTITAAGTGGTATSSVTVTVNPPPAPTVSISANPATIVAGGSATLSWTSTNAELCSIDQGIGIVNTSGSANVSPATTSTYTITANGTGGTATASTTVTVLPAEFLVQVATSQGTKLAGVKVYAFTASGTYTGKSATTDGNGQAHFPQQDLADGAYKFRVDYLGYQFWSEVVTIPAVSSVDVVIPEEAVEVQVTTSSGPAQGVKVYLFTESGTYLGLNQQTDAAGKVSFDLPVGKNYKFRADVSGSQYWSNVITVAAGSVNQVTVNAGGGRFQVTVQKAAGVPLAGITAYLFTASGTYLSLSQVTDASGLVAFTVPAGTYKVRADYLGYQFWSEQTQVAGDTEIVLSIPHQQVEIQVRGIFQGASEPFAGVPVYLFTSAGTYLSQNLQTNASGTVTFDLPEKPYKIRADYLGQQYWSEEFVWQNKTVSIPMADAEISVTGGGMPQQGIKVYVFSTAGTYLGLNQATTQAGKVAFHLPAQSYKFRVDYQGSQYWSAESLLQADQVNPISVSVGGGSFTVKVLIGPAAPLAGVKCYAFTSAGVYLGMSGTTDANGSVAFALANGAYKFRVDYRGYQFWSEVVTIPDVSSVEATIPEEQVEVQVTTSAGPATGVRVYLFTGSGTYLGLNQQTDAAGKVSFDLPVGKNYKFRADVAGSQYWSAVHTVTGDGVNTVTINTGS